LSIKLANGELHRQQVNIVNINGKPRCKCVEPGEASSKKSEWSFQAPMVSIEISRRSGRKPQVISDLKRDESSSHLDARDPLISRWVLELQNRKRSSKLVLLPLDVRGVEFIARFPTAKSRLEN
jgi:hypothetical protein